MNQKIQQIKQMHSQIINDNYQTRMDLLANLRINIVKYEKQLLDAFMLDLNKSNKEAYLTEINVVLWEIDYIRQHLKSWIKPHKVASTVETCGMKSYLWSKPKGKVLIISPFNYPFNLTMMPLVGAIASGNRVLIKMANDVPNVRNVTYQIINETFNKQIVDCLNSSDLNNYDEIYEYEPNIIFFTGSTNIGKQIELECVKRNIEYITELGGQCPCIVYDVKSSSIYDRIIWTKFLNGGQTCVTINYILYNKAIKDFKNKIIDTIKKQLNGCYENRTFNKIINQKAFNRLVNIINEQKDNILYGGNYDSEKLIIEPTVIEIKDASTLLKYGELFGPILFIYELDNNINDYLQLINQIDCSPLAAYLFSNNQTIIQSFLKYVNAGGYCINDCISHMLNHHLPFGGVYNSGSGHYHGKYSFDAFSFLKPIVVNNQKNDIQIKYYNHNGLNYEQLKMNLRMSKKLLFYK